MLIAIIEISIAYIFNRDFSVFSIAGSDWRFRMNDELGFVSLLMSLFIAQDYIKLLLVVFIVLTTLLRSAG